LRRYYRQSLRNREFSHVAVIASPYICAEYLFASLVLLKATREKRKDIRCKTRDALGTQHLYHITAGDQDISLTSHLSRAEGKGYRDKDKRWVCAERLGATLVAYNF